MKAQTPESTTSGLTRKESKVVDKKEGMDWDAFAENVAPSMDVETLAGDVRDRYLNRMRKIKVPWGHLTEREQQDEISALTDISRDTVRLVMQCIAEKGFPHVPVIVKKVEFADGLKIQLTGAETVPNITALASHGKMGAVLVLCEASNYFGERFEQKPEKDEPGLPLNEPRDPPPGPDFDPE